MLVSELNFTHLQQARNMRFAHELECRRVTRERDEERMLAMHPYPRRTRPTWHGLLAQLRAARFVLTHRSS